MAVTALPGLARVEGGMDEAPTPPERLPRGLLRQYQDSLYRFRFGGRTVELRVDEPSPELREVHAAHGAAPPAFLTAWNPASRPMDEEENARRNRALREDARLLGRPVLDGEGAAADGSWAEESFLILGLSLSAARELARRYGQ